MKEINLLSLDISFFKGIRHLHADFGKVTTISGDNGLGKTTIADAFSWVLFNKDSLGRTKFRIRTIGENIGDTFVEARLSINGVVHSLRKQLLVKQNDYGTEQNDEQSVTSKYYVDAQQYTKKDFDAFVSDIITESAFRTITSPTYFFSLSWKDQRNLLSTLVAPISDNEINSDHQFDLIEEVLKVQYHSDVEAMQKHLAYQVKEVKQTLDTIPVQIAEQQRMLPDTTPDWTKLNLQLGMLTSSIKDNQQRLSDLRTNKPNAKNDAIRAKIEFQQKRIDEIRTSARNMHALAQDKYDQETRDDRNKLAEYKQSLADIKRKLDSIATLISRTKETIREQTEAQEVIRREWAERITNAHLNLTVEEVCPTCGQPLPYDKVEESKQRITEQFNLRKAEAKKELTTRANATKALVLKAQNDIASYQKEVTLCQGQQKAVEQYITNIEAKVNESVKHAPKSVDELVQINAGYTDAVARINELQQQLVDETPTDNAEAISELENKILDLEASASSLRDTLATKTIIETVNSRIEELTSKQSELRSQYDSLIRQQDLCLQYQLRAGEILESRINEHFHYVKFSLFKRLVNGSVEPFCEGYVDGVPYQTNINSASRLNCGLDVCNAFSNHLQISAPMVIDNAESNLHIIPTTGQQIRLYVSNDTQLRIENN